MNAGERKLDMDKVDDRLSKMYTFEGDKQAQYDQWAETYESDLVGDLGYVAHLRSSEIFNDLVADKNTRVLDLGCGTGLVGETLKNLNYTRIDGADFSAEMLEIAAQRGVYRALHRHDVTQPMARGGRYDALISVGLFSFGIPYISDLHNAVNCVGHGCPCVITVNGSAWTEHHLEAALHAEAEKHRFTVEQIIETEYIPKEGINARVLVIRR